MIDLRDCADALWRAIVYVSVVQLHLNDDVLLARPLRSADIKARPTGHWGTVPGTAWLLAHIGLHAGKNSSVRFAPLLGAGHTGVAQLALSWLTGDLGRHIPDYSLNEKGLAALAQSFPDVPRFGSEVHPDLPAGDFLGGCLGGALAFACGAALHNDQVIVPIIGDGECETPTTAASWLAARELEHAKVLPIIHLNQFRMGGRSILGRMSNDEVRRYFEGLGWECRIFTVHAADGSEHDAFHRLLRRAAAETVGGQRCCLVLRCEKGWGGPAVVDGVQHLGTAKLHKTPLTSAASSADQRARLQEWLFSYRPRLLFDEHGCPTGALKAALELIRIDNSSAPPRDRSFAREPLAPERAGSDFTDVVTSVLGAHGARGDFRVFSPDEMQSNRLGQLAGASWVSEVLAEEVLFGWLAGWTSSGRRGLLVSYEAFSTLLTAGLVSHLKQRRLRTSELPSLNLLLTSYGWHNVYTHGDPSLITTLVGIADPAVRIYVPGDPMRLGAVLDESLDSMSRVNVIVAGKHSQATLPSESMISELSRGLSVWEHLSDSSEPDVTILCAGDIPATAVGAAIPLLRRERVGSVRVVGVADLTVLGDPANWPRGLRADEWGEYVGRSAALLVVTLGHPAAVWGLLAGRIRQPVRVIGWREPPAPISQQGLAIAAGLDASGIVQAVIELARERERTA
ncbi:hypothetical protein [Nocardia farcinica]|uniref:phosphoketolase family protein n=1 Tax=Nocardia farcinica TaxID=37329 RepID=UPI001893615D|nr:hypothetical protein [Nocardia farcinica]MBF6185055.1 hypothetical protein [Nocardia farcinica]MBF6363977.1 hypothetical protein [Nocardia farcinica]